MYSLRIYTYKLQDKIIYLSDWNIARKTCKVVLMCQMSTDQRCCSYDNGLLCEDIQEAVVANVYIIKVNHHWLASGWARPWSGWCYLYKYDFGAYLLIRGVFLKCVKLLCFKRRYKLSFNTSHLSLITWWEIHRYSVRMLKGYLAMAETLSCKASLQGWILNSMSMLKRHEQGKPYPVHYFLRRRSWRQNWYPWRQNRFVVLS